jgi:hypothetical protein
VPTINNKVAINFLGVGFGTIYFYYINSAGNYILIGSTQAIPGSALDAGEYSLTTDVTPSSAPVTYVAYGTSGPPISFTVTTGSGSYSTATMDPSYPTMAVDVTAASSPSNAADATDAVGATGVNGTTSAKLHRASKKAAHKTFQRRPGEGVSWSAMPTSSSGSCARPRQYQTR